MPLYVVVAYMHRRTPSTRALGLVVVIVVAGCAGVAPAPDTTQSPTPEPTVTTTVNGTATVHFINVGQSVSTLVVGPTGETMLVDTGDWPDDGEYVLRYLKARGIDRLDSLVVSHTDADHIGGNAAVIDYYETEADGVGAVYDPGLAASTQTYSGYLDAVEAHNVTLYETRAGDAIPLAGLDVRVMGPPEPYLASGARNENSIVLRLAYGTTSVLLTGDAEAIQEADLVERYGSDLNATVLKAGHHGSATSTSAELLDAVTPNAVIVSSAYESRYGHPHEETLQRLADRSLPTYWTATHGNIVLASDGHSVTIRTQRAAPTAPLALRAAPGIAPGSDDPVGVRETIGGEVVPPAETPVAADGGTPVGDRALALTWINADAEGDDRENLNGEYLVFRNMGDETLNLTGWTVTDTAGNRYTVPEGVTLEADATVTLHTGSGTDTEDHLYWGSKTPVWNNGGDTVTLRNNTGTIVLEETYE